MAQQFAQANQMLEAKFASDVQSIEASNQQINELDDKVLLVLRSVTGRDFGVNPAKRNAWWAREQGHWNALDKAKELAQADMDPPAGGQEEPAT
jgi:hypothetical protein